MDFSWVQKLIEANLLLLLPSFLGPTINVMESLRPQKKHSKVALLLTTLLQLSCSDSADTPYRIEVDIQPTTGAPSGMRFSVNGESTGRIWHGNYPSIDEACADLTSTPLQVGCITAGGESCGVSELFGVCCWARDRLSSPLIKGTVYVQFSGDGTQNTQEGHCEALDGSSTHSDGHGPDAGS